ncbi:MAG: 4Fe-4S binding protein, partial [Rikenellaceae bacterium]
VTINFIRPKKKWFRVVLFALNTTVLGAWCGSFLSLSMFTTWAANGISLSVAIIPVALLLVGIIMPLLGKKGAYCSHHCPLGAAQELLSLTKKKKLRIPTKIAKPLNRLRDLILAALLFVMWIGVGFSIMDYEIFSIFLIQSASTTVIVLSSIFLVLSIFIHRPYCRFVCPTGAILTLTQKTKQ